MFSFPFSKLIKHIFFVADIFSEVVTQNIHLIDFITQQLKFYQIHWVKILQFGVPIIQQMMVFLLLEILIHLVLLMV